MSLIEQALRRLQEPRPTAPPPPQTVEPKPVHSWPTTAGTEAAPTQAPVLIATGAILLLIALWLIGRIQGNEHAVGPSQPEPSSRITARPVRGAASNVTPPAAGAARPTRAAQATSAKPFAGQAQEQLFLSGVVEGRGPHYALINGAIVAVGEQIGGATLLEATQGAARLRRANGSEVVLRVPQ